MTEVDEAALVEQIASALRLIVQPAIAAGGSPAKGWALFDQAVARVREQAAAEGLVPLKQTKARVDDLKPDEHGIVAVKHNLGSERVMVRLFTADGRPRQHRRMGVPISADEVEVIAESTDVAYAEVEMAG